jgi:uncharacterized membrane protein YfcA
MILGLLALGLAIGTISGMVGVGGGIFLVPALHYLFKFSQHEAQGTSIAVLVPPIGIFAALEYYRHGYVRLPVVAWLACGFLFGALLGAVLANQVNEAMLRRFFATFMLFIALQMLFSTAELRWRTVLPTAAATGVVAILAWIDRRLGIGRRLRARMVRWIHKRRPPRHLDEKVEYHI